MDEVEIEQGSSRLRIERGVGNCRLDWTGPTGIHAAGLPLIAIDVFDRMSLRVEHVCTFQTVEIRPAGDEIVVRATDEYRGILLVVGLRVTRAGELAVRVDPEAIHETREMFRLLSIEIAPELMDSSTAAELLLPLNTGMLCKTADKPALRDRFLIYGEQSRWELLPTLPVCAVQSAKGGMVALAVLGAAETACTVWTDGLGGGGAALSFHWRSLDIDPVEKSAREIRFIPIPPGAGLLAFTADRMRRHVINDLHKPTLEQRAAESPEVKHLLGAYIMKLFFGVHRYPAGVSYGDKQRPENFILTMTFDEAQAGLARLHEAGVDHIYTQMVGWNINGHDGLYPTRFPVEPRCGGEEAFRKLIRYGQAAGDQMMVHDNYIDGYLASPDIDPETITVDPFGRPQMRGFWGGAVSYLLWPMAFSAKHLDEPMQRVRDLGVRGPYYLDGMGSPLYVNYHPTRGGTRTQLAMGIDRLLKTGRSLFGSSATETAFLYCCITPDLAANPGGEELLKLCHHDWPITQLFGEPVPLWQMTFSGLVLTENQGIGWTDTMRALLLAQHPRYEWSTRPGVHPVLDEPMIEAIRFRHELLIKRFGHLRLQRLIDYRRDGMTEITTFEDGTVVAADFATETLTVNGDCIDRPARAAMPADGVAALV